jgi:hypothetical protein
MLRNDPGHGRLADVVEPGHVGGRLPAEEYALGNLAGSVANLIVVTRKR